MGGIRIPVVQTMLDDTSVTHSGYNDLGDPINVDGMGDVTLFFTSAATGSNDLTAKIYVLPDGDEPADTSAMHWVATVTVDVNVDDIVAYAVNCACKWIWISGEHASGAANVTIEVLGYAATQGRIRAPTVQTMLDDTSILTASPADVGDPINVDGFGDVTVYVQSAGTSTNDLTCKIYVLPEGAEPADSTAMHWVSTPVVDVDVEDIIAVPVNCACKWIWVNAQHATTNANATIKVVGFAANL